MVKCAHRTHSVKFRVISQNEFKAVQNVAPGWCLHDKETLDLIPAGRSAECAVRLPVRYSCSTSCLRLACRQMRDPRANKPSSSACAHTCGCRRRPIALKSSGIGVWDNVLEVMSVIAVITNCALIGVTSTTWWPDDVPTSTRVLVVVFAEHAILFLKVSR